MTRLYELSLERQINRLRRTAIGCGALGVAIDYGLLSNNHRIWALLVAIIALQATVGSLIIVSDLKRDLKDRDTLRKE